MNWMQDAKKNSQRFVDSNGKVISEWEIYLGLQSGRINQAEHTNSGYNIDGDWYQPLGQK